MKGFVCISTEDFIWYYLAAILITLLFSWHQNPRTAQENSHVLTHLVQQYLFQDTKDLIPPAPACPAGNSRIKTPYYRQVLHLIRINSHLSALPFFQCQLIEIQSIWETQFWIYLFCLILLTFQKPTFPRHWISSDYKPMSKDSTALVCCYTPSPFSLLLAICHE